MKDCRITVCRFWRKEVIEESKGIKHGGLNIGDERCPREEIGIPEGNRTVGPYMIIDKLFPWIKLENKIGAEKRFSRKKDLAEKQHHRNY